MSEQDCLTRSSGFVNCDGLIGYLSFRDANFLVGTGKYYYHQVSCWGYVIKKKES